MTLGELKKLLSEVRAPDDAELFIEDGYVNERGEVNRFSFELTPALVRETPVDYRSSPAFIATPFELDALSLPALQHMNAELGTAVHPAVLFRPLDEEAGKPKA